MDDKKSIVLVPTDFTEVAEYAIEHAAGICKLQGAKLTLLHIINKDTKTYLKKEKLTGSAIHERLEKKAKELTDKYNIEVDFIVKTGSIFSEIGIAAKELGASLLTLGTHGKVGVQHIVGSYAMKVIESSPAPVIVVQKRSFREGYKNIVLPIDDSTESKQKVKWAIHIARKFNSNVRIFAMHSSDGYRMAKIKGNLLQIRKFFVQNDIAHTFEIADKNGVFPKQILTYSQSIDADLILIMTNPDNMMPSFIIGKWEEQILFNDSLIPIMAINPVELSIVVGGM
ncbi:MAG: universal stress protein [Bacteroidetes bacterium]|nr:universal stress protein [Bacteroidota bacterium]